MSAALLPCPFCGAGESRIDESAMWNGRTSQVISVRVRHWCERIEGQPQSTFAMAGKTEADAVSAWNRRVTTPSDGGQEGVAG